MEKKRREKEIRVKKRENQKERKRENQRERKTNIEKEGYIEKKREKLKKSGIYRERKGIQK